MDSVTQPVGMPAADLADPSPVAQAVALPDPFESVIDSRRRLASRQDDGRRTTIFRSGGLQWIHASVRLAKFRTIGSKRLEVLGLHEKTGAT